MQVIEQELIIPADGRLPEACRPFFGRKARIVLLSVDDGVKAAPTNTKRYQTLKVEERIIPTREVIHER